MNVPERIHALRLLMEEKKIDAYIIPSADSHQSEYVGEHGSLTPKIPESLIWLIFLHKFKILVDRTAVLCYNTIIGQEGCVVYEIKN